jgi:glycosyltransferase involved in cell wall biosynthesis
MLDLERSPAKHRVHFLGERANVEPYFFGSDVFLMSSRVDPFPCVIHEAMAAGLPIIAFEKAGGAPEALAGGAGAVVPYADYEQTASLIRMFSMQPEITAGLRTKSMERVHSRYRFSDYGDKLIDLAESITRSTLRRPRGADDVSRAA